MLTTTKDTTNPSAAAPTMPKKYPQLFRYVHPPPSIPANSTLFLQSQNTQESSIWTDSFLPPHATETTGVATTTTISTNVTASTNSNMISPPLFHNNSHSINNSFVGTNESLPDHPVLYKALEVIDSPNTENSVMNKDVAPNTRKMDTHVEANLGVVLEFSGQPAVLNGHKKRYKNGLDELQDDIVDDEDDNNNGQVNLGQLNMGHDTDDVDDEDDSLVETNTLGLTPQIQQTPTTIPSTAAHSGENPVDASESNNTPPAPSSQISLFGSGSHQDQPFSQQTENESPQVIIPSVPIPEVTTSRPRSPSLLVSQSDVEALSIPENESQSQSQTEHKTRTRRSVDVDVVMNMERVEEEVDEEDVVMADAAGKQTNQEDVDEIVDDDDEQEEEEEEEVVLLNMNNTRNNATSTKPGSRPSTPPPTRVCTFNNNFKTPLLPNTIHNALQNVVQGDGSSTEVEALEDEVIKSEDEHHGGSEEKLDWDMDVETHSQKENGSVTTTATDSSKVAFQTPGILGATLSNSDAGNKTNNHDGFREPVSPKFPSPKKKDIDIVDSRKEEIVLSSPGKSEVNNIAQQDASQPLPVYLSLSMSQSQSQGESLEDSREGDRHQPVIDLTSSPPATTEKSLPSVTPEPADTPMTPSRKTPEALLARLMKGSGRGPLRFIVAPPQPQHQTPVAPTNMNNNSANNEFIATQDLQSTQILTSQDLQGPHLGSDDPDVQLFKQAVEQDGSFLHSSLQSHSTATATPIAITTDPSLSSSSSTAPKSMPPPPPPHTVSTKAAPIPSSITPAIPSSLHPNPSSPLGNMGVETNNTNINSMWILESSIRSTPSQMVQFCLPSQNQHPQLPRPAIPQQLNPYQTDYQESPLKSNNNNANEQRNAPSPIINPIPTNPLSSLSTPPSNTSTTGAKTSPIIEQIEPSISDPIISVVPKSQQDQDMSMDTLEPLTVRMIADSVDESFRTMEQRGIHEFVVQRAEVGDKMVDAEMDEEEEELMPIRLKRRREDIVIDSIPEGVASVVAAERSLKRVKSIPEASTIPVADDADQEKNNVDEQEKNDPSTKAQIESGPEEEAFWLTRQRLRSKPPTPSSASRRVALTTHRSTPTMVSSAVASPQPLTAISKRFAEEDASTSTFVTGERVWALWPQDKQYYSGTIVCIETTPTLTYQVNYDDGDSSRLAPENVRPLSVDVGDKCFVGWTKRSLAPCAVVNIIEPLQKFTVQAIRTREKRTVTVNQIVHDAVTITKKPRKDGAVRNGNAGSGVGRDPSIKGKQSVASSNVTSTSVAVSVNSGFQYGHLPLGPIPTTPIFQNRGFILTNIDNSEDKKQAGFDDNDDEDNKSLVMAQVQEPIDKAHLKKQIQQGGGHIFDSADAILDYYRGRHRYLKPFTSIYLITSRPSRTKKSLMALSLGIPILSYHFIKDSCISGNVVNANSYFLANGWSTELQSYCCAKYDSSGVFKNLVVYLHGGNEFRNSWEIILKAGGVKDVIGTKKAALKLAQDESNVQVIVSEKRVSAWNVLGSEYFQILKKRADDNTTTSNTGRRSNTAKGRTSGRAKTQQSGEYEEKELAKSIVVVNKEWIIQCLVNQRVLMSGGGGHPSSLTFVKYYQEW